ncbi:MAG: hypothetical protein ACREXU_09880 [Gammaproteobacteria bacterium]
MLTGILRTASLAAAISSPLAGLALAALVFRGTVEGEELDLSKAKQGPETEAVKHFVETGENRYRLNRDEEAIRNDERLFEAMDSKREPYTQRRETAGSEDRADADAAP